MNRYRKHSQGKSRKSTCRGNRQVVPLPTPNQSNSSKHLHAIWAAGIVAGGAILATPIILDAQNPRVIGLLYADVSQSNQPFKSHVQELCRARVELLKSGDLLIDGKFADQTYITSSHVFEDRDRLALQRDCQVVSNPPAGVGKQVGTNLMQAVASMQREVKHQRTLGNTNRVLSVVALQAAEPGNQARLDLNVLTAKVRDMVKDGSVVLFIGPDLELQQQLKAALVGINKTDVCTYADGKHCLEWAFENARRK